MWPFRTPVPRVTVTLSMLLLESSILPPSRLFAQSCVGTKQKTVYSTTFNSTTGNSSFPYNIPQFPNSYLTLYAVTIQSVVTVSSDMSITNNNAAPATSSAKLYRTDDFNSTASGDFNNSVVGSSYNAGTLAPGANKTFPAKNSIYNNPILYDSIYTGTVPDVTGFQGSGTVAFTYTTTTAVLTSTGGLAANYSTLSDAMNFSVSYYYCNPGTLATDLVSFTCVNQKNGTILLAWNTENEQAGRTYEIQTSTDGTNFSDYAAVASDPVNKDAGYSYSYPVNPATTGNLYFRLRIIDYIAPYHYSPLCIIMLDQAPASGFSIYPNPPEDHINLVLPGANQSWQVDILATDGTLVQSNYIANSSPARVNFVRKMAAGVYYVRALNTRTSEQHTGSFVAR